MKYDFAINTEETNSSHAQLLARIAPGSRVLELGCATGYLSEILTRQKNCRVVGVEIDPEAAERARAFCEQVLVADLDNEDLSAALADRKFDVLLCADVLEHLKHPAQVLVKLKPYLAPNGRLLASVPNVAHASIRLELLQGHFDYETLGLLDETHLHFYTRDSLINMLMDAGFACYDIDYTIHDMADEAIAEHLATMGLEASAQVLERFHKDDALAYQFVVEALPAHADVLKHRVPTLTPKPMASSLATYGQKQEKIVNLERQLMLAQDHTGHLETHISQLKKHTGQLQDKIDELTVHNNNRQQHIDELAAKYNALIADSDAMDERLMKTVEMEENHARLQHQYQHLRIQKDQLQAVLDRIHGKFLFRAMRWLKRRFTRPGRRKPDEFEEFNNYAEWVKRYDTLSEKIVDSIKADIAGQTQWPKIAVLMPVYNTPKVLLEAAIDSVLAQVYPYWELCIADDCSDAPHIKAVLQRYGQRDARIKTVFRDCNGHISAASNSALNLVEADYVALLDHDDVLASDALYRIAQVIRQKPEVCLIYSDEDKLDNNGERYAPYFKPDWNPDLLLSHNFVCHLGVYKTGLVRNLGGFRSDYDGAQDYDLALRYVEQIDAGQIVHIPHILYHWRAAAGSTANGIHEKPYAQNAMQAVMQAALSRRGACAEVLAHECLPGALRVRYALPDKPPLVSIVMPTRNGFTLLKRCVESILEKTDYPQYEIIIIDNGSDDIVTLRYLQRLQGHEKITVIRDDSPFNYAALNNRAVSTARGELLALLNNDLEVINPDWLTEMAALALRPDVGAVGAKLWYPNDTLQHGGVIVGLGGVAGHSHKHFPKGNPGFCGRLLLTQNLSAVTAACMVLRKSVYTEVGGFDETHLSVAFNDVDLCLRIREQGYWNVWTPYAQMYHYESATRGYEDTPEKQARFAREIDYMKTRWGESLLHDPAYNPNLTLDREDFSLAWPPRTKRQNLN
ncbi:MAG: hypothetical protein CVV13_06490 [Gammaproteobacteria bacterium HGW-Gammaproteobacteria-3]|nr:MAG: hypothetical protein CVV13_06490 [Gammaproteobacteria bacterium HGW-Gammaproteobacteria-3]